ncbi:MAG: AMP-binding protein, partial [Gammaproteobacteria bacterium]|nr:AMP-binding protein [Gammaproteobacteria bacterium]
MSYVDEARWGEIEAQYPTGDQFLSGPAALSQDELRRVQEARFLKVIARAWHVPFYARRWRAHGLEPGDILGMDDLEKIPIFSKSDLMASVEEFPPFGDYHGINFEDQRARASAVFHTTSGTTGMPQPLFFGARDREIQNCLLARAYRLQGLRDADVVHSVYGFGMVNGGHYIREAILHFTKALLMPAGTGLETPSETQVELMRHFGATVLVGFADYLKRLAEVAVQKGIEPGKDITLRMISGHLGQENRAELSQMWGGAAVYDWYGVGDTGTIAAEGPDQDGLYIFEDAHLVELIDPETGAVREPGESGAICDTVLFKDTVYPVVRFNTNDVTTILPPKSESRINFRRMDGFQGRADSMVKLRGINVYPTSVGAYLAEIEGL